MEEGIAALQAKYEECVAKKEELKDKCDLCSARLTRAEKVSEVYLCLHVINHQRAMQKIIIMMATHL